MSRFPKKINFETQEKSTLVIRPFPSQNLAKSLNLIIYGVKIQKHFKSSAKLFHNCLFYLLEDDLDSLQWLSKVKPYTSSRIDLKTIKNITDDPNFDSKLFKRFSKFKESNNLLYISHGDINENKVLILRFKEEKMKALFWQGLQHLVRKAIERDSCFGDVRKLLAKRLFIKADTDGSKTLDFEEIKNILQQLHIEINHDFLVKFFEKYDKDKNKSIDWEEFQAIIDDISLKPELYPIFQKYCDKGSILNNSIDGNDKSGLRMSFEEFQNFLKKEQKQEISEEEFCQLLFLIHVDNEVFSPVKKKKTFTEEKKHLYINFSEFCSILFSKTNELFDMEKQEIYQDMTRPLVDYYINSSHNTYLLANQVTGDSSTKAYVNAFAKGCRCVELDCWNGDKGEPIIYHGHTLTSKILFRDVIQTIKDYAFRSNPYPVILSFENHCNEKQQDRMAEILEEILGDSIYTLPENYYEYENFPSPDSLKYKILIKNKGKISGLVTKNQSKGLIKIDWDTIEKETNIIVREEDEKYISDKMLNVTKMNSFNDWAISQKKFLAKENFNAETNTTKTNNHTFSFPLPLIGQQESSQQINLKKKVKRTFPVSEDINNDESQLPPENIPGETNQEHNEKVSAKLKKLVIFHAIKINLALPRSIWNISSIRETTFDKIAKEKEDRFQDFIRIYFLRVYPTFTRVDSSNFDPIKYFNFGTQMIALNVQRPDYALLLYMAKFKENGGAKCGYILKPSFLQFSKPRYLKEFTKITKILHLTVISGQQLRPEDENDVRDVVDPYVEVSFRGIPWDEKENSKAFRSAVIENNGFNPKFGLECHFKITCPELAMIVFRVFDQEIATKDLKIGWNAMPFGCIRPGFRVLPLLNSNLDCIDFSYLLVKCEFFETVPEV